MNKLCVVIANIMCVIMFIMLAGTEPATLTERLFRAGIVLLYITTMACLIFGGIDENN